MSDGWKVLAVFMAAFCVCAYFALALLAGLTLDRLDSLASNVANLQAETGTER